MRIGIYSDVARQEQPTGIGRHVVELLRTLAKIDAENEYLLYYPDRFFGKGSEFPHCPQQANFKPRPVRFPQGWQHEHPRLWWKWYLPRVLRRDGIDIFHGPNHYLPEFDRSKSVVTIHDLATFKMPVHGENMDRIHRQWVRHSLKCAGAVIALSEHTKRDVEEVGVPAERIQVIYGAGSVVPDEDIAYERTDELRRVLALPEKYILFVGALQPRKNLPLLIRAFAALKQKHPELPHGLVLAGPPHNAAKEVRALICELKLEEEVRLTGYVEPWQMPLLHKMADLFVLPSRYEGFGMIAVEAMAYGTPVVATRTSCIEEAVGNAALLVDVDDVDQLTLAMARMLDDEPLRNEKIALGLKQARRFTWEANARKTLDLYRRVHLGLPLMSEFNDEEISPTQPDLAHIE